MDGDAGTVNAGEFSIGVLKHHRDDAVVVGEAADGGGITGDVFGDFPECAGGHGDWSGGAEDFDAVYPDCSDAVFLDGGGGDGEFEDDASPWSRAVWGLGVVGGGWWGADGVGEVVLED